MVVLKSFNSVFFLWLWWTLPFYGYGGHLLLTKMVEFEGWLNLSLNSSLIFRVWNEFHFSDVHRSVNYIGSLAKFTRRFM